MKKDWLKPGVKKARKVTNTRLRSIRFPMGRNRANRIGRMFGIEDKSEDLAIRLEHQQVGNSYGHEEGGPIEPHDYL